MDNGQYFSVSLLDAVNFIHLAWQEGLFEEEDGFDSDN